MLTRHTKAYSSSCCKLSVYLQLQPKIAKLNLKTPYFGSSGSFKVIDVDTTEKPRH